MSARGRDNLRIVLKVLSTFIILLGLLYAVYLVTWPIVSTQPSVGEPGEVSGAAKIANAVYAVFFFLTFIVPLLVLRGELRRRKQKR